MSKLLGIMGGTFNPIHNGHLAIAAIAQRELGLDEVRCIPTGDPPHKRVGVSSLHRLDMARLAVQGRAGFTVSDIEVRREGHSYTCDTLAAIHIWEPDSRLIFIIGGDMLLDITSWRNPEAVLRLAELAVAPRPGDDPVRVGRMAEYLKCEYSARLHLLSAFGPDISSTEVRRLVGEGGDISRIVPPEVERYITQNNLYTAMET